MQTCSINQNLAEIIGVLKEHIALVSRILHLFSPKEEDIWLHTEDVMRIFKKSEKTIYNWRQSKALKFKIIGGTAYYLKSDLFNHINK